MLSTKGENPQARMPLFRQRATCTPYQAFTSGSATSTSISTPKSFNYLSLPRELRDQVMDHALHPGEVYITTDRSSLQDRRRYGVQLLASCRQVYEEGHEIWYGKNTFRITSCSDVEMRKILVQYQKKHRAMISKLVVEFTVEDLPTGLQVRSDGATISHPRIDFDSAKYYAKARYDAKLANGLEYEWLAKACSLLSLLLKGHEMRINVYAAEKVHFMLEEMGMRLCVESNTMEMEIGTTITGRLSIDEINSCMTRALGGLDIREV